MMNRNNNLETQVNKALMNLIYLHLGQQAQLNSPRPKTDTTGKHA